MMHLDHAYDLDDEEVLARMHALTDYWSTKHGIGSTWNGNEVTIAGKIKGVKFDGQVRIGGGRLKADVKAGFLAEKLGGRQYVERKLADYLDPNNTLEELQARVPGKKA